MNLKLMLEETSRRYGAKTAIVYNNHRITYAELDDTSNRLANALQETGIKKGDRIAMLLPDTPDFVAVYFGIVKAGAIAVPLDTKYKLDEFTSLLDDCRPRAIVLKSSLLNSIAPALTKLKYMAHFIDIDSAEGATSYPQVLAAGSPRPVAITLEPEDTAMLSYTSGPTTQPRGVVLTHRSLYAETIASAAGFAQTEKDVSILFALPLHHVFGLVAILLSAIYKGSTVVIVPGLSVSEVMATIERERATIFMGVPYVHALMIRTAYRDGLKNNLSSLRLCASAGAPLPAGTTRRFKDTFGYKLIDFWGLTEAVCHITCPPVDGTGKSGSVGKALPGWEIKIVGDRGRKLPADQPGEVIVRGPIMEGYYHNPQATAEVIKDGWLYTGDLGRIDGDGYLFLTGRKKDLIIRKGQNIYPADIEAVLGSHPRVAEAAVVGTINWLKGEDIKAFVRLKDGATASHRELRQYCLEHLAHYKMPQKLVFTDGLPTRTATGEISKAELKKPQPTPDITSP